MGTDLDDILTLVDCPTCGTVITVAYRQLRLQKAAACRCGNLLRLTDDTPIGQVQALIDAVNPVGAVND